MQQLEAARDGEHELRRIDAVGGRDGEAQARSDPGPAREDGDVEGIRQPRRSAIDQRLHAKAQRTLQLARVEHSRPEWGIGRVCVKQN